MCVLCVLCVATGTFTQPGPSPTFITGPSTALQQLAAATPGVTGESAHHITCITSHASTSTWRHMASHGITWHHMASHDITWHHMDVVMDISMMLFMPLMCVCVLCCVCVCVYVCVCVAQGILNLLVSCATTRDTACCVLRCI